MATTAEPMTPGGRRAGLAGRLIRELASCTTEADIVQVLYADLHPEFGYDVIVLQVLEREGRLHEVPIDHGVLQDVRRLRLADSHFRPYYERPRTVVTVATPATAYTRGRGPGLAKRPQAYIWVPLTHRGQVVASVSYQLYASREVAAEEVALLERVHESLGVVVSDAYLNELTRNQSISLSALNAIARALSSTHDEEEVAAALRAALMPLLRVDRLELVVPGPHRRRLRVLQAGGSDQPVRSEITGEAHRLRTAREVLASGKPQLRRGAPAEAELRSGVWVPVVEGEQVRAVLSLQARQPEAYEQSTVTFLEQVADSVSLALRNAWSYEALEAQRRHLEVVNAVVRRLASSLDRWSIVRTLRRELSPHFAFDLLSLSTVRDSPEGPLLEGYVWDAGQERQLAAAPLDDSEPSREAYARGTPVVLRPDRRRPSAQGWVVTVTGVGRRRRVAARSTVSVPVRRGADTVAVLTLQSARAEAFDDWHVRLLEDVGGHVSLALATADQFDATQVERRRLEALHVLEMGVAGAGDERQIADAVFEASGSFLETSQMLLVFLDAQGRLTGYRSEYGAATETLPPKPVETTKYFRRVLDERATVVEAPPPGIAKEAPSTMWSSADERSPAQVLWVPLGHGDRVIGALSAQRYEDVRFSADEIRLLESAAPVVGIALRTVRLNRANERALAHSVRIQEMAALAGSDLGGVVASIADQAHAMLEARGTACWAFDDELRVSAEAATGDRAAARILSWSNRVLRDKGLREAVSGVRGRVAWTLVPLWYAHRLVGALGSVHRAGTLEEPVAAPLDFVRHAAIAIENARLAAETRGRIHTLEAVAAFADLDIIDAKRTRVEMCRLVERALEASHGALWLLEGEDLVSSLGPGDEAWVLPGAALPSGLLRGGARAQRLRRSWPQRPGAPDSRDVFAQPVTLEGRAVGVLTADASTTSPTETRRLMSVLAGQAALVLARMHLVAELDRQARQLNAIVSHAPVGVVLEDADGRVVYANPVVERLYGVRAASLAGAPAGWLLQQAGATVMVDPEAEPGAATELRLGGRDTVVRVRRVDIPGSHEQPASVLTLHEDVTQERAVREAKDLMLRAIGHEVRSPAAAMRSTIAGLVQWADVMTPEQRHALIEEAYEQSDRLLHLVESQLTIAKLETGRFEADPIAVSLRRVFEQVQSVLWSRYGRRVEVVDMELPDDLPDAHCEPSHVEQVLTNLVGNALEYTHASRIEVSAAAAGGMLEVTVEDNGEGLPTDRVATLFEKTHPAGRNRARGGLGLGLYLCRLVVERSFGGRIWLDRTAPTGTAFKFTLPSEEPRRTRRRPISRAVTVVR
jgi:signal transduction histidine kinase/putative methionine-R-sulfoxide reductase with GAF domain